MNSVERALERLRTRLATGIALVLTPIAWWAGYGWVALLYWAWRWLFASLSATEWGKSRNAQTTSLQGTAIKRDR
jgi:hypothetical protein